MIMRRIQVHAERHHDGTPLHINIYSVDMRALLVLMGCYCVSAEWQMSSYWKGHPLPPGRSITRDELRYLVWCELGREGDVYLIERALKVAQQRCRAQWIHPHRLVLHKMRGLPGYRSGKSEQIDELVACRRDVCRDSDRGGHDVETGFLLRLCMTNRWSNDYDNTPVWVPMQELLVMYSTLWCIRYSVLEATREVEAERSLAGQCDAYG